MKLAKKIAKRSAIIVTSLVCVLMILIRGYSVYEHYHTLSDAQLEEKYNAYSDRVVSDILVSGDQELHYLDIGDISKPILVLIHGAPGSIRDRNNVLKNEELYETYRIIVPDRLGYGRSMLWSPEVDIVTQSQIIIDLIQSLETTATTKPLIVGHSYGGTLIPKMLMLASDEFAGGINISGALDPETEKVYPISHLIKYKPLYRLLPPMLRTANDEKLAHADQIREDITDRDQITAPILTIHGDQDSIVDVASAYRLDERMPDGLHTLQILAGKDHPLQFSEPELLTQEILDFGKK